MSGASPPTPADAGNSPVLDRSPRSALIVFVAAAAVAVPFYIWAGRDQWFFLDEWDFLATRSLRDPESLLRPHYEHWTTLPIVAYRILWQVFGIRTYLPYQLLAIASHLVLAALLRWVMRRAGVGPWLSTLVAIVILFFGAGSENVIWAFQVEFTAALAFGVVQLLLADHDGAVSKRDWLGLVAGLLALMCASPGIVMVAVVGLAALLRGRWRAAAFHTVPLAGVWLVWATVYADQTFDGARTTPGLGTWLRFVLRGLRETFDAISSVPYVSWLVAIVLLVGLAIRWRDEGRGLLDRASAPIALLIGGVLFLGLTGYGRAGGYGVERATESRYLYIAAVMALPAVAVAAQAIVRRWRYSTPFVVVVLLAGLPGNIAVADDRDPFLRGERDFVLTLPTVDLAREAPRDLLPGGILAPELNIGWLVDGVESGRVPSPGTTNPLVVSRARLALALAQRPVETPTAGPCEELALPNRRTLQRGQSLRLRAGSLRVIEMRGGTRGLPTVFGEQLGRQIDVVAGPFDVTLEPVDGQTLIEVCG